ncbi:dihydrofolate reductase [Cohnella zeiphila]|uniref:Dihydrofolate reductase n=1 Tax=Cohnella zeiphila TaxID=2761120 RepID=A0A7X0SHX8_9BACL|nr:dihydrofolate reductase [Cohnella zeiphila]MBB6730321.1 dihydrofolate reductase [Cohnella zeiphila]
MTITLIAAAGANGVIGAGNALPWKLPAEMAYFKAQTIGKTVLMGRKTFESFGSRPLKDRANVILSRTMKEAPEGCRLVRSAEEAVSELAGEEIMVIGGAEIYALMLPVADRILLTEIERAYEGDAYFPEFGKSEWVLVSRKPGIRDEKNDVDYYFCVYERRRP